MSRRMGGMSRKVWRRRTVALWLASLVCAVLLFRLSPDGPFYLSIAGAMLVVLVLVGPLGGLIDRRSRDAQDRRGSDLDR